ncbi:LacI family DNA-binding transcriptional regulator [bacterium]|nr:LacI family DNA-binding transcriptional regulator [bacterium]
MKTKRVLQKDVAKVAEVSRTAVSLVLNDQANTGISAETRQRILAASHKLSYKMPVIPQESRTGVIGIVPSRYIPDFFIDPYYLKIYEAFNDELKKEGYLSSFIPMEEKFGRNCSIPESIYKRKLDGIAVMGTISEEFIKKLSALKLKIVLVSFSCRELDSAWFDNLTVVSKILDYLFSLGHRRIALITPESKGVNFALKEKAFSSFRKSRNLSSHSNPVFRIDFNTEKSAYEKIKSSISQIRKIGITAILGADDLLSFGAIKALTESGFRVPHDISVAGIDDIDEAKLFQIPLTTMQIPKKEMGKLAAEILIDKIENENIPCRKISLSSKLIIRKSTCPVNKKPTRKGN